MSEEGVVKSCTRSSCEGTGGYRGVLEGLACNDSTFDDGSTRRNYPNEN